MFVYTSTCAGDSGHESATGSPSELSQVISVHEQVIGSCTCRDAALSWTSDQ